MNNFKNSFILFNAYQAGIPGLLWSILDYNYWRDCYDGVKLKQKPNTSRCQYSLTAKCFLNAMNLSQSLQYCVVLFVTVFPTRFADILNHSMEIYLNKIVHQTSKKGRKALKRCPVNISSVNISQKIYKKGKSWPPKRTIYSIC